MAFDESFGMVSPYPVTQGEDERFHQTRNSLSRLSICTRSVYVNEDEEAPTMNQPDSSVLACLECFDGAEADGEVSDDVEGKESDSDKEIRGLCSLPVNPSRRRRKFPVCGENESNKDVSKCSLRRQRRVLKEKKKWRVNGECDGGGGKGWLTVLTRAKGGEKSLRMGLEEVKACRDLGIQLDVPDSGRISVSTGSNFNTQTSSGGGDSPIATWRISSPGDDPKEVKARLKVWAHAVALASASRQVS